MNIVVSGVKPTGTPTLGNYLGALKKFVELQNEMKDFEFFIFIADLHAITVPIEPGELKQNIKTLAALYLACGLNPERLNVFIQSEVKEHAEMGYIMQSISYMGELSRMTQFKDKSKNQETITSALFTYPTLMAGDILLYDAKYVPVGDDQKQHLELTRDLAIRFNNRYGKTFIVPEELTSKTGARIMDLQDPTKKMSKSEDDNNRGCIFLIEPLNSIKKKIKSAVTDSEAIVRYDKENKPGISNLMNIYANLTNLSFLEIEEKYTNKGYGDFKGDLAEIVVSEIEKIQKKYKEIISSSNLDKILNQGRERATFLAQKKIKQIYTKIGLGR